MKMLAFLSILLVLSGCGPDPKVAVAKKNLLQAPEGPCDLCLITSTEDYNKVPDTFTAIFWPTVIDWDSGHYIMNHSYLENYERLIENVILNSDKHDEIDRQLFSLLNTINNLELVIDDEQCNENNFPRCLELGKNLAQCNDNNFPTCDQVYEELDIAEEKQEGLTTLKLDYVENIQKLVDKEITEPVNWLVKLEDKGKSKFEISEGRVVIKINKFDLNGQNGQVYSTKDRSIVKANYSNKTSNLTFSIREKNMYGSFTGNTFEFNLYRKDFLTLMRFTGKLQKLSSKGVLLRDGISKLDFRKKVK